MQHEILVCCPRRAGVPGGSRPRGVRRVEHPSEGPAMSKIKIDVRGTHTITLPPERGVLSATMSLEGSPASSVVEAVTQQVATIRRMIDDLYDDNSGPVTWYSIEQVRTSSYRPSNKDGVRLPVVHVAKAGFEVKFVDFAALGRFVVQASAVEGFTADYIDWTLTEERRVEIERQARQEAVRNARTLAQEYADALELGPVTVRSISGSGSSQSVPMHRMTMDAIGDMGAMEFDATSEGEDLLKPQHVEVSSSVGAQFVVAA
jgi:uncharacterized protein YggE